MEDLIRKAVDSGSLNGSNISFAAVRRLAGRDSDCWSELGRGRAILGSVEHLDQYLYSYGPMTEGQWNTFLAIVAFPKDRQFSIVDYGCGQGLATALLFDNDPVLKSSVRQIVLIEPSAVALGRAVVLAKTYCPRSAVYDVNKKLDDVQKEELRLSPSDTNIHIFSNVLDIDAFDSVGLFNKICHTRGRHMTLAVSHNRNFYGGADRIRTLEREVCDKRHAEWLRVESSIVTEFNCPKPAISWCLRLEVL